MNPISTLIKLLQGIDSDAAIAAEAESLASFNDLVVVYISSLSVAAFRGAMCADIKIMPKVSTDFRFSQDGTHITDGNGLSFDGWDGDRHTPYANRITAVPERRNKVYCVPLGGSYAWTFETELKAHTFDTIKNNKPFCRGIVFSLKNCVYNY